MSSSLGALASVDWSVLLGSSSGSSYGISAALLQTVVGGVTGTTTDPLTALTNAERDESKDVAQVANQPAVARAIVKFTAAVTGATNVATLLKNPDVLNVLLTANGLGDQTAYTALATKALLSDPTDAKSLANTLPDTRWKTVAQTYNFAAQGLTVLQDPKVIATIANGYAEVTWRDTLDATTPGLSNALDFRARANTATTADAILGDATFRTVVTTALGIPPQIAYQDIGAQEQAITSHLDIKKLQDPKFVEGLTQQYLVAMQQSAASTSSSTGSNLFALAAQSAGLLV